MTVDRSHTTGLALQSAQASRVEDSRAGPRQPRVLMFAGGGVTHVSGGVGTLLTYLRDHWAGWPDAPDVRVIDTRGSGGKVGGAIYFAKALAQLAIGCLGRERPVLHVHMTTRGSAFRKGILCALGQSLGCRTIVHQHGADFEEFYAGLPGPVRSLIRRVLIRANAVVVLGRRSRDFFTTVVGVSAAHMHCIPNGIISPPAAQQQRPATGEPPLILFLGRLGERKGVPELLAALKQDRLAAKSWRAVLAGDGEAARFRQDVIDMGLSHRVQILDWQDREAASRLLRSAAVLVLPSHHEALPMAILEALAHGVAVVATPVGEIPEFLRHDEEALLVPPGDVGSLSDALAALLDDPARRARLAQQGRQTFEARLQIDAVAQSLARLYQYK